MTRCVVQPLFVGVVVYFSCVAQKNVAQKNVAPNRWRNTQKKRSQKNVAQKNVTQKVQDGNLSAPGAVTPMCTPSLPKKRRTNMNLSARGERELCMHPDAVIMTTTCEDDDIAQALYPPLITSTAPFTAPPATMMTTAAHTNMSCHHGLGLGLGGGISSTMTTSLAAPLNPSLFDMHICVTDNLHLIYPSSNATPKEMQQIHALHRRLKIISLPVCIARDQQEALEKAFEGNAIRASAARVMYVCTSCALAGKPVPLRPPMRYSMLHSRFTCLTCHRSQRCRGQQQQRRDKGARLTTSDTSIMAIDMIGKMLYTSMDLLPSVWRCYVFCLQCAKVHEVQDGPASNCPLSLHTVMPACMSYHMIGPRAMPVALDRDCPVFMGINPYTYGADSIVQRAGENTVSRKPKKGCCICSSNSVACKVPVMVRRCEGLGCPITYAVEVRCLCAKHVPPPNLVLADRFVDERQLMEFCYLKGRNRRNCV